jgi:hypothetical protein
LTATMRRCARSLTVVALLALAAPAAARADVLDTYQDLAERELSPAPLVPTSAPPSLRPLDETVTRSPSRRRSGYGVRLVHYTDSGPDAIIVLEGGSFRTLGRALRDGRRLGFRARKTRVRGRAGHVLTRRLGPTQRMLVWSEAGRIYTIGTGTPKKVSLKQLRATAAGLDRLGGAFLGSGGDPDLGTGAVLVTTASTVSLHLDWGAHCFAPDGSQLSDRGGSVRASLLPLAGGSFSLDLAAEGAGPWAGRLEGTVAADSVPLKLRAVATTEEDTCDTGEVSFTLAPLEPLP